MSREPIKISQEDLMSEGVEGRLREQSTVKSTKDHYERANVVAPQIAAVAGWRAWLLKSIVYLALFGLVGGAVGTLAGQALSNRPDRVEESAHLMEELRQIDHSESTGRYSADDARSARRRIREIGQRNPQFVAADIAAHGNDAEGVTVDPIHAAALMEADRRMNAEADLLLFTVAGLLIAAALAAADRVIERDTPGAVMDGGIAAVIGAAAGAGVALLLPTIGRLVGYDSVSSPPLAREAAYFLTTLALLGACIGAAPGIATRNARRVAAGIGGGVVGGLIGGALVVASMRFLASSTIGQVAAFGVLGMFVGIAMGWAEEAAKQGWLRVAGGLIAGKQFILYRNPTFVGSAPMSHIYLFRDSQVGRRHAAIFQVTGGYEIENLPLGGPTLVNGQAVTRTRLRRGDKIAIGRTTLVFDEKVAS